MHADDSEKSREELIRELEELRDRMAAMKPERATSQDGTELAAGDRALQTIAENVDEVIFMFTPDWQKAIYVSPAYEKIWRRPVDELYRDARSWIEAIVPGDRGRVEALIEGQSRGEVPFENSIEYRICTPGGDVRRINGRTYPVRDGSGNIVRVTGIAEDITERRKTEDHLRESGKFLNNIFDCFQDGISILDKDLNIIRVNHVKFKWHPDMMPISGKKCFQAFHGRSEPCERCPSIRAIRQKTMQSGVVPFHGEDGKQRGWLEIYAFPLKDDDGNVIGVIEHVRDITGRMQTENALKESEEKFRVLAETTMAGIMLYRGKKVIYANPALEDITGYDKDELQGMNYWDMVDPDQKEMARSRGLARQRGLQTPSTYELKIRTKSGGTRWVELSAALISYHGLQTGLATIFDITDRKRSEAELHDAKGQAELYLDLMGHDINNLNQIGIGFLEMALATLKLDRESRELIARPLEAIEASSRLIANVRKLQKVREGGLKFREVRIAGKLREIIPRYSDVPGREVRISCDVGCDCTVMANDLLDDVFANIIHNAIKHSTGPLAIDVHLSTTRIGDQKYALVAIEDDGPGIPDELKGRLFSRSGNSNSKATGRGIGLHLVRTLVEDFHGKVWVEDRIRGDPAKGTRFVIMLPAIE